MKLHKILDSRLAVVFIIPFLLGIFSVLSFQPFNFTFVNFLIIPCFFLILTYVKKKSKNVYRKKPYLKNLFLVGYFFGIGFFMSGIYWIANSLTYDEKFVILIPFVLILIPLFLGLFFGFGTLIVGPFITNNFISILIFCSSLSLVDFLRSKILTGFPWNLWAYSWSWFPEVLQILNPIGLFAFNLLSLTIFCGPLLLIFSLKKINISIFFILIVLFFSNYIYGSYKIAKEEQKYGNINVTESNSLNIKIVSPNFDLKYNQTPTDIEASIRKLIRYSESGKNKKTIFIWPEGVFTGYELQEIKSFKSLFKEKFTKNEIVIFGINTREKNSENYYNSMVAINNNFDVLYKYNKMKLVPFGEFLPFESFLNKFGFKKITQGHGSFLKGAVQKNLIIDNFKILPLICYEIIFTGLTQNNNFNLIFNISEDAWFGGSIGPHQHFAKAIFRAIESNTYVARSANQGISAFIKNTGKVAKRLEPNETGNIELKIVSVNNNLKNRNDLIFFVLLFTYTIIFFTFRNKL